MNKNIKYTLLSLLLCLSVSLTACGNIVTSLSSSLDDIGDAGSDYIKESIREDIEEAGTDLYESVTDTIEEYRGNNTDDEDIDVDLTENTEEQYDVDLTESSDTTTEDDSDVAFVSSEDGSFSVTMLDVGQGLSILVKADDEYLLYDGGGRDYSSYVVAYLKEQDIDELDVMVISHYDEDHINGLVGVLNTTEVDIIYAPDYETDTKIYASLVSAIESSGTDVIYPEQGYEFSLGNAVIEVVGPVNYLYDDDNNMSVSIRITYGDFSVIICGDAEEESESDMLASGIELDSDLYIVNHHGSSSSSTADFIDTISPDYAFISCGLGNSYGHPTQETLDTLLSKSIQMFRSDLQGEVTAYSDGDSVWFSTEPCNDWTSGSSYVSALEDDSNESVSLDETASYDYTYVLNIKSMKIHLPECIAVEQMSESNKEYSSESRESLILQGYTACGICNP